MARSRHDFKEFTRRGVKVVVLGPENATSFKDYWKTHDLPFIGIPDPRGKVLRLFGQEIKLFKFGRMPAQVLVDRNGIALFAHYGNSMSDIPDNEELFVALDKWEAETFSDDNDRK